MKQREGSVRSTLVAAQRFLDANAIALAEVNASGARKELDQAVQAFAEHAVAQGVHGIGVTAETKTQHGLRLKLRRQYLKPMATIARAKRDEVPALGSIRMPKWSLVGAPLADAAKSIADAAEPFAAVFVAAGLKPDFLEGLREMIQQLWDSLGGRKDHRDKHSGSTIALGSREKMGRKVLRMLDAVMAQLVPENAQLLSEWAVVRRIPQKPGAVRGRGSAASAPSEASEASEASAQAVVPVTTQVTAAA